MCLSPSLGRFSDKLLAPLAIARLLGLLLLAVPGFSAAPLHAQLRDSFESPEPSWRLVQSDCTARVVSQRRVHDEARHGAAEQVQFTAERGSFAYLACSVPPAAVIAELAPSLWVKCDRAGVQMMARVVLPRTADPSGRGPLTTLLDGQMYSDVGSWEKLAVPDLAKSLERQVRVLRTQFGPRVDAREAYVDMLVLNAYGGPGVTNVWLDDLSIAGHVAAARHDEPVEDPHIGERKADWAPPDADAAPRSDWAPSRNKTVGYEASDEGVAIKGSVLVAEGRPLMVRLIEHNGEPLDWLAGLGFNAVLLADLPTRGQLDEARRCGMWIVAPPPELVSGETIGRANAPVLAWYLGSNLSPAELDETRHRGQIVRKADSFLRRPLACGASAARRDYSRVCDVLVLRGPAPGGSAELADFGAWVEQRARLALPGTPIWVEIPTQVSPAQQAQRAALMGRAAHSAASLEPDQIRLYSYYAIAAGARGLWFRSASRLDGPSADAQLRRRTFELVNHEMALIEPWAAGGTPLPPTDDATRQLHVRVLQTERSWLVLAIRRASGQQYVVGPSERDNVSLDVPSAPLSAQAFRLSRVEAVPLANNRRSAAGVRVLLPRMPTIAAAVLTEDPLVVHHLNRTLRERGAATARLTHEIAGQWLDLTEAVHREIEPFDPGSAPSVAAASRQPLLEQARQHLRQAEGLLGSGDLPSALDADTLAMETIATVRRGDWERVAAAFPSPVASPLITHYDALPDHFALARRLSGALWSRNLLPAGEMEGLDPLQQSGWMHVRHPDSALEASVEISPQAAHAGQRGLAMSSWLAEQTIVPGVVEIAPVSIATAPVNVRAGQIVRIHGWAKLPGPLAGTSDGLLVIDSLAGIDMAERIIGSDQWREFSLYRAADRDQQMTVRFILTGAGQAFLDDVSIVVLDDASGAP